MAERGKIIGIDLGTSNSAAAVIEGGRPVIIPSAEGTAFGGKAFPSWVAFTKDGQVLVGEPARRQAVSNPEGTVTAIKRKMGQDHKTRILGKEYTPQQISAFILQKIKRDAEAFLGGKVEKAVITVPAYFNDNQRQATKDAGVIAGLDVVRIINEPTAAALAYGLDKGGKDQKILVFDFGGGTLDVTIMDFGGGVFEVISTSGDTQLGGTDMDNTLVEYIAKEFKADTGIDITKDKTASQRVREAAEKAKIELSSVIETEINLPYLSADQAGPKHLTMKLTRAKLEELVRPIVERCRKPMEQAIADAKLTHEQIDKVILVGGPTRMPMVQKFVEDFVGPKIQLGVDPMECVAMGAAIQGGVLEGSVKDILLLDVTPLSLGVETLGGVFTKIIERNTTIPTRKSQIFSTAADGQADVEIHVLQGERPMAPDNVTLGRFHLTGIAPAPRGMPQIEVTFDIDADGILHVTAKDRGTGKEQKIVIKASSGLSEVEIERMVHDADRLKDEDRKKRALVDAKNEADSRIYQTEKNLKEHKDRIDGDDVKKLESGIESIKAALKTEDTQQIKNATSHLDSLWQDVAQRMYQSASANQQAGQSTAGSGGGPQGPEPGPSSAPGEDSKVVDADYEILDDDKK